jgi:hypothetical protein
MHRIITTAAALALLAASPAIAGGSIENPADKKAPVSNEAGTDNPANAGKGSGEPAGQGAPVPNNATEGSGDGSHGADTSKDDMKK